MIQGKRNTGCTKQPRMRRFSIPIKKGISVTLDSLSLPLCKVLVLIIGFGLPIVEKEGAKDVLNSIDYFRFGAIRIQLVRFSSLPDVFF